MKRHLALLVLSVFLIAVTLVLYSAEMERPGFHGRGHGFGPSRMNGGGFDNSHMIGMFGMFRLADELEISNPQLLQLRMMFQKEKSQHKSLHSRRLLHKKLSDPNLKEEDVKKIAEDAGKAVSESIMARFQMMQELRKILTPEQFKKLHERREMKGKRKGLKNMSWADKSDESSEADTSD